ncbi:hypothetical protein M0802_012381 [Mischocyttarus mexicanus]|nr:hypothetical protein M0802_012381 [Mischocyttarus mexicanus]
MADHLTILKYAIKGISMFDGKNIPLKDFIRQCNAAKEMIPEGSEIIFIKMLKSRLIGDAYDTIDTGEDIKTIDQLLNPLVAAFGERNSNGELMRKLAETSQDPTETVHSFSIRMKKIGLDIMQNYKTRNHGEVPDLILRTVEEDVRNQFLRRLRKDIEIRVPRGLTLKQTLDSAVELERSLDIAVPTITIYPLDQRERIRQALIVSTKCASPSIPSTTPMPQPAVRASGPADEYVTLRDYPRPKYKNIPGDQNETIFRHTINNKMLANKILELLNESDDDIEDRTHDYYRDDILDLSELKDDERMVAEDTAALLTPKNPIKKLIADPKPAEPNHIDDDIINSEEIDGWRPRTINYLKNKVPLQHGETLRFLGSEYRLNLVFKIQLTTLKPVLIDTKPVPEPIQGSGIETNIDGKCSVFAWDKASLCCTMIAPGFPYVCSAGHPGLEYHARFGKWVQQWAGLNGAAPLLGMQIFKYTDKFVEVNIRFVTLEVYNRNMLQWYLAYGGGSLSSTKVFVVFLYRSRTPYVYSVGGLGSECLASFGKWVLLGVAV